MATRKDNGEVNERSSREVLDDIERTRAEMGTTIDELSSRLSPGQLLDQVWGTMRGGALAEQVREHPVPVALLGAAIGWLAVERMTGTSASRRRRTGIYFDERSWDDALGEEENKPGVGDRVRRAVEGGQHARERASEALETGKERVAHAGQSARETLRRAQGAGRELSHRTGDAARRAGSGVKHMMEDNPLMIGAAAIAFGLLAGLAVPSSRWEDETVGDASDELKRKVRETGQDATRKAAEVARETATAVREEVQRDDDRSAAEKARDASTRAADTSRENAERRDLTPERAKQRLDEARKANPEKRPESGGEHRPDRPDRPDRGPTP
jgi:hypothetical protein